ncbi:MAG: hypothetical protein E6R03_12230 [Hyphomicrobiaceae bacterium]|nr:MAG: hypothetical protein E6R03_12230 [Hyphomicrobiaceae bacterium]
MEKKMNITPMGDRVLIRKCFTDHVRDESGKVVIFMTDNAVETTNWVEIIAVGPKCRICRKEHIGTKTIAPEIHNDMVRVQDNDFIIKEMALLEAHGAVYHD